MITLAHPWLLLLLVLPWIVRRIFSPHREERPALRVPFMAALEEAAGVSASPGASVPATGRVQLLLTWCCWALIVLALARPQWLGETESKTVASRDLLLAVDLSASMDTEDFKSPSGETTQRLEAVKEVLDEFLTRREGDRVGLILFGSAAFVQVPFTEDTDVCRVLLEEAQVRMAGPKTMLGDAIGLGITVFERSDLETRLMILLTDGNDSGSKVPPEEAARVAADHGIVIHTIAVGDPATSGSEGGGEAVDERELEKIAGLTGGQFFRASDRQQLEQIYDRIDAMDSRELEVLTHRPTTDLYSWPLAAAVLLVLLRHGALALLAMRREPKQTPPPTREVAA